MDIFELVKSKDHITVNLTAYPIGQDLCIMIFGGDVPHIGAVSYGGRTRSVETVRFEDHKEWLVNERLLPMLQEALPGNFILTSGIHIDNITKDQIGLVLELCEDLSRSLIEKIQQGQL